jgi:hypothetical protein
MDEKPDEGCASQSQFWNGESEGGKEKEAEGKEGTRVEGGENDRVITTRCSNGSSKDAIWKESRGFVDAVL